MHKIPFALPDIGKPEAKAVAEAVMSGWVTQGPRVEAFEQAFSKHTGSAYACAVANCTMALHYALLAVGVRPGDTVLTVSHSFIATANVVRHCGAEPVFVDIDPATLNMDLEDLERTLEEDFEVHDDGYYYKDVSRLAQGESPLIYQYDRFGRRGRLGALLAVHQLGMPMDMSRTLALTKPLNIPVVEDAACAAGSEIRIDSRWEKIGRPCGDIACFSFHPRKVITTGDGGMLTTSNSEYDKLFRLLRHHGMSTSDADRHQASEIVFEDYPITGFNGRLTDIQAAIGIEQMKRLPDIVSRRRKIAEGYQKGLSGIPGLRLIEESSFARSNWQSFPIFIDDPAHQKTIMQDLLSKGVNTRRGVMCAHLEPPYAKAWQVEELNKSKFARDTGILLPMYSSMSSEDVTHVVNAVRYVINAKTTR